MSTNPLYLPFNMRPTDTSQGCVIIISRNNLHLTKRAVASALAQTIPCDVFVYDNASTDNTKEWLQSQSNIYSICCYEQFSLAGIWNKALRHAFRYHKQALVLNNDVEIRPDTYEWLSSFYYFGFTTGVSVRTSAELQYPDKQPDAISLHPDFSCFCITKETYELVGPFDSLYYPAFYEDNDYHVRMHRKGINAISIDLPFLHHGSQTIKLADPKEANRIKHYADKNKERFRRLYGCYPGTPAYDKLFDNSRALSNRIATVATAAKELD